MDCVYTEFHVHTSILSIEFIVPKSRPPLQVISGTRVTLLSSVQVIVNHGNSHPEVAAAFFKALPYFPLSVELKILIQV